MRKGLRLAARDDVEAALAFDQPNTRLLVYCHAGINRSLAIEIAILAVRMEASDEQLAVEELFRIRPEAVPNLQIIRLADQILARNDLLVEAVLGRETPKFVERRRLNRYAYKSYYGCG